MSLKYCESCGERLISFRGYYLHPEKQCSGLTDCVSIVLDIEDDFLHKKWIEKYGTPSLDDTAILRDLEKEKVVLEKKIHNLKNSLSCERQLNRNYEIFIKNNFFMRNIIRFGSYLEKAGVWFRKLFGKGKD